MRCRSVRASSVFFWAVSDSARKSNAVTLCGNWSRARRKCSSAFDAAAAEEPGNQVVPAPERREGRGLLPRRVDGSHAFQLGLDPRAVLHPLRHAERLGQRAHVRGEPVVAFGPVGPQPRRRFSRDDPAFERRPALALRCMTANPVGRPRQFPRGVEVRPGLRAPNLRGAFRAGQVLALPVQLIRILRQREAVSRGRRTGGRPRIVRVDWFTVHRSRFNVHGSRFPGASSTRTLNPEP